MLVLPRIYGQNPGQSGYFGWNMDKIKSFEQDDKPGYVIEWPSI